MGEDGQGCKIVLPEHIGVEEVEAEHLAPRKMPEVGDGLLVRVEEVHLYLSTYS